VNRRIILLNLALLALLGALGWILRANWLEAQSRERAVLRRKVTPKAVLAPPSLPGVQPAVPAEYIDVANKMLFSKDRNPTVVVEPPKPAPEPVMPALPSYNGQMAIGEQPVIFLSFANNAQSTYHAGEQIGDFKLVSFDEDNIAFEWKGKSVARKLEELRSKQVLAQTGPGGNAGPVPVQAMPWPTNGAPGYPKPLASGNAITIVAPAPEARAAPATAPNNAVTSLSGPSAPKPGDTNSTSDASDDGMLGPPLPGGFRSCVAADTSPAGTVHSGYRKVQAMSIFGPSCDWEPSK
jgi:hypothetical protein